MAEGWISDPGNPGWNLWNGGRDVDIDDPGNWQFVDTENPFPQGRPDGQALPDKITEAALQLGIDERFLRSLNLQHLANQLTETARQADMANARSDRQFAANLEMQRAAILAEIDHNNRVMAQTERRDAQTERRDYAQSTGWYMGGPPGQGMAPQQAPQQAPPFPSFQPSAPVAQGMAPGGGAGTGRGPAAAPREAGIPLGALPAGGGTVGIGGMGQMSLGDLQAWATQATGLTYDPQTGKWSRPETATAAPSQVERGWTEDGYVFVGSGEDPSADDAGDETQWAPEEE